MTEASAIHTLDSLTVASWAVAGGAVFTVIIAVAVNAFAQINHANQERKLSKRLRSIRLLIPRLRSLNWTTIGGSGRHASREVSKRLTFTHIRRPSISAIAWAAAITSVAVSVSLSINNRESAGSKLPNNVVAVIEQRDAISVLETTASGKVNLVSIRKNPSNTITVLAPNPRTARRIAYNMLPSFGWSPDKYFGCLDNVWNQQSGWRYDAEDASGAYGIPQALPGSKMASAGTDWQTDPTTQIKWGLGYIKAVYGNPCSAWAFEQANGYY